MNSDPKEPTGTSPDLLPPEEAEKRRRRKRLEQAVEGMIFALNQAPERLHVTDLAEVAYKTILPKRKGRRVFATVTIRASAQIISAMQETDAAERWRVLLVAVPEDLIDRGSSPIIRPGDVDA